LQQLFDAAQAIGDRPLELPSSTDYQAQRTVYLQTGGGTPPPSDPPGVVPPRPTGDGSGNGLP
jgi:hypothetical protein